MNTPVPVSPPPAAMTPTVPSLGAALGTAGALFLASKWHLNPTDPFTGGAFVSTIATAATAFFHWLGQKIGGA